MKSNASKLMMSAVFASMICVCTAFIMHIPVGNGYIHIGDSLIYIAACYLPTPYAMLAAMVGGGLADGLTGYFIYIIPTIIIKPLNALCFSKNHNIISVRNILGAVISGIVTCVGYFAAGTVILGSISGAAAGILANLLQAVGSMAVFTVVGAVFDKSKVIKKFVKN